MPLNNTRKLWLWVLLCAVVIVALWATIFYPASLRLSGGSDQKQFTEFQNKINRAFSIFKKNKPASPESSSTDETVQDLRERVFGDSVKR